MRYRFGQFELDVGRAQLARAGEKLAVRPKVLEVVQYLIEHPARLVSKQELLDALWPGQQVDETAVPWTISHARRALGQNSGDKAPIETVHGRGYRWRAAVEVEAGAQLLSSAAPVVPGVPPLVGRERTMAALAERLIAARSGRGGLCLLTGDAGIGKTRCLDELSALAREQGFTVWAGGAAPGTLAQPYFPWIQLLRSATTDAQARGDLHPLLARLRAGDPGPQDLRDVVLGRHALCDAVSRFLLSSGRRTPLLLVLDDLDCADAGTLELLAFVADELRGARALVVAAERTPGPSVDASAGDGGRRSARWLRDCERFELDALSPGSVAQYVGVLLPHAAQQPGSSAALHRLSAGYPLYLQESLRGLLATQRDGLAPLPVPHEDGPSPLAHARGALHARLNALDADTRRALACAAALGEHFELNNLLRVSGLPLDTLLPALDRALHAGFVQSQSVHRFRFRHALFRELAYGLATDDERMRCHRAAAQLLQDGPDAAERSSEIAHHRERSLALGDPAELHAAALAAAQAAARVHAFDDAAVFYARARAALARVPAASPREHGQLLLAHAQALLAGAHDDEARSTLELLIELASARELPDLLLHAARSLRGAHALGAVPDALAQRALERALQQLPAGAHALRAQASSLLSWLPAGGQPDMARSRTLSAQALELARGLDDRAALHEALYARLYALSGPDDIDALLAVSDELLALDGEPRGWVSVAAHGARHAALLQRGELAAAHSAAAQLGAVARERGFLEQRWQLDRHAAQHAFTAGDLARAETELTRLADAATHLRMRDGAALLEPLRVRLALARRRPRSGEAARAASSLDSPARESLLPASTRAYAGRLALELDRPVAARRALHALSADDFAAVPRDRGYLHALCNLALIAVGLGDRPRAERAFALLEPYAAFSTPDALGIDDGPVSHFLGLLAAFLGHDDRADGFFAQAGARNEQLGLRTLLAHSCFEHARWSLRWQRSERARSLRARAIELSDQLGLERLGQQARALPV